MRVSLDGWSKRDEALWLDSRAGTYIKIDGPLDAPFRVQVDIYSRCYAYLDDAIRFAVQLAEAIQIITGPEPLPGSLQSDEEFLAGKGLA